ncbi:hypothetical protein MICRO80W_300003 [Micrococcus luteus]|nr:hypothetical protein MICRO80W_300003 [Micrococcus luteus]
MSARFGAQLVDEGLVRGVQEQHDGALVVAIPRDRLGEPDFKLRVLVQQSAHPFRYSLSHRHSPQSFPDRN